MSIIRSSRATGAALALALSSPTFAPMVLAEEPPAAVGAQRQANDTLPRLSLQAEASAEIVQDTAILTLGYEVEGDAQDAITRQLNERLNAVLERARKESGVEVRNGVYRVWPNTDRDGKITAWRGRAEVILESKDFPKVSTLAASLNSQMSLSSIDFTLSPQARATEEKRLLDEAAKAFRERAETATRAFGFAGYEIRKLDLGGSGAVYAQPRPEMMLARASMAADMVPAPKLEAGTATVSVTVQGEVALRSSAR